VSESDFRPADPDDEVGDDAAQTVETSPEAPEADVAEQRRDILGREAEEQTNPPDDVDPADAAEQRQTVDFDEDDYR
jgi:hypothetical protein